MPTTDLHRTSGLDPLLLVPAIEWIACRKGASPLPVGPGTESLYPSSQLVNEESNSTVDHCGNRVM